MQTLTTATSTLDSSIKRNSGLPIFIMAIAGFVIVTTEFLIIGLLPRLSRDLNVSIAAAGQLITLFAFTVMLFGPYLTAKLSHINRKKLFTFILLVFAGSSALAALSPNIWVLAIARFIPALMLPVFWGTASETAGQLARPGNSGKAVSQVYLGISAALVFGIPLGTLAADAIGWRETFWILAAVSTLLAILILAYMPTLPVSPRHHTDKQTAILNDKGFLAHVGLSILTFIAMFTAYTYLADILERLAFIPSSQVGWWLMGFGAVGMLGNHIAGRMVDRNPLSANIVFLALLGAGMLITTLVVTNHFWLAVALTVWGIAYTGLFVICQVRVMKVGSHAQAFAASMNISAANAGIGIGAMLGGLGLNQYGLNSLTIISTVTAVIAIALALFMKRLIR